MIGNAIISSKDDFYIQKNGVLLLIGDIQILTNLVNEGDISLGGNNINMNSNNITQTVGAKLKYYIPRHNNKSSIRNCNNFNVHGTLKSFSYTNDYDNERYFDYLVE